MTKSGKEFQPTTLKSLLEAELREVDANDIPSAAKFHDAANDGNFARVAGIKDEEVRRLVVRYGYLASRRWVRALLSEDAVRALKRAQVERRIFAIISFVSGGMAGAIVTWLLHRMS